jgi:hypothetical protein
MCKTEKEHRNSIISSIEHIRPRESVVRMHEGGVEVVLFMVYFERAHNVSVRRI